MYTFIPVCQEERLKKSVVDRSVLFVKDHVLSQDYWVKIAEFVVTYDYHQNTQPDLGSTYNAVLTGSINHLKK